MGLSRHFQQKHNKLSVFYHNLFDYPLMISELSKWTVGKSIIGPKSIKISKKGEYLFIKGREKNIVKRKSSKKHSDKKMALAEKAAKILSGIPTIEGVLVTGSLAMKNSKKNDDIDLMIITNKGTLWTSRILSYLFLYMNRISLRKYNDRFQKDKICLNIWMDMGDLSWDKDQRNIYTAHEIAQTIPLVNKNNSYERFLWENRWIKDYWPNAIKIRNPNIEIRNNISSFVLWISCFVLTALEPFARMLQFQYMKPKITREVVTDSRAIFHPIDRSKKVNKLFTLS